MLFSSKWYKMISLIFIFCGHSVGALDGLPAGVLRGDEEDVEEVGDDHHEAIEGQLLFPLGVLGRP